MELKYIALITLVVQSSALVLVMKYAKSLPGPSFISSTAVIFAEIVKFGISTFLHFKTMPSKNLQSNLAVFYDELLGPESMWLAILVPSFLYFIQNNLQYLAVTLLDAATFQVTYQLKILTTAMFSVVMLKTSLSNIKWISLVILTSGVALVQFPSGGKETKKGIQLGGLVAVLSACFLSGLAGVWFEKVLKGSKATVWLRNCQLSLFSVILGLIYCYTVDYQNIDEQGFFVGYTVWTWLCIFIQAVGGLLVAVVVKYADNILKGFATSIAIILSSVLSIYIFDFQITLAFGLGSIFVIISTYLYSLEFPAISKPLLLP